MKYYLFIISMLLYHGVISQDSQPIETHDLTASITGFNSDNGKAYISIYNSKDSWLTKIYKGHTKEIVDNTVTVIFEDLPTGEYAISLYHDENDNGEMDANWMGIPSEDYACSRGAKGFMGPPKWKNAVLQISESQNINIIVNK